MLFGFAGAGPFVCEDFGEGEDRVHVWAALHEDRGVGRPDPWVAHIAAQVMFGGVPGLGL